MKTIKMKRKGLFLSLTAALAMATGQAMATPADFGVAAAVQGQVQVLRSGSMTPVAINSGDIIATGDRLVTGEAGAMQLMLSDGTVITLGADTRFGLDSYAYDTESHQGKLRASVEKGFYKLVTGRISEQNQGAVSVSMPTGTVHSLGTIFQGEASVDATGEPVDTVVLLGPGNQKDTISNDGEGTIAFEPKSHAMSTTVEIEDEEGNTVTENATILWRAGYAVTVSADGSVSEPYEMSGREFGQMVSSIARSKHDEDGEGDDDLAAEMDDIEGEDLADATEVDAADDDAVENEDDEEGRNDLEALLASQEVTEIADFEDIEGLKGDFQETGIEMENGGTFDFRLAFSTEGKDLDSQSMLDYIGFNNIDTTSVTDGELSWDVAADGEPTFTELDVSSEDGTLIAKGDCVDVCEGSATVLNAGQGNVAKFYILELDTGDDEFEGKVVKPGGNNNFPQ